MKSGATPRIRCCSGLNTYRRCHGCPLDDQQREAADFMKRLVKEFPSYGATGDPADFSGEFDK